MRTAEERDLLECEGTITSCQRGDTYLVDCMAGTMKRVVICKRSGRLGRFHIRLIAGDRVRLEMSPYDLGRGRITRRL